MPFSAQRASCSRIPIIIVTARNAAAMADALAIVSREEIYAATGVQLIPINTIYQLFAASRRTPRLARRRRTLRDDPRSVQLLAHPRSPVRYTDRVRPRN